MAGSITLINYFIFDFLRWNQYDTRSFIAGSRLLFGLDGGADIQGRLSKPLALFFPGLLEWATGLHPEWGFLIQNILFYIATLIVIYRLGGYLYRGYSGRFVLVFSFLTCAPFAIFSLFFLTDISGWFFGILGVLLAIRILTKIQDGRLMLREPNERMPIKKLIAAGIISSVGMLFKESAVVGALFFFVLLLISKHRFSKKIIYSAIYISGFISLLFLGYIYNAMRGDEDLIARHADLFDGEGWIYYNFKNIKQLYRIFDLYWLLIITGIIVVRHVPADEKRIYLAFLISGALTLVFLPIVHANSIHDRILFMCAPFFLVFIPQGVSSLGKAGYWLLAVYGIMNIAIAYGVYKFDMNGMVPGGLIIGVSMLLILQFVKYLQKKKTGS